MIYYPPEAVSSVFSVSGGGLPSLPQAEWSVGPDCSIISANFTFIFVHRNENPEFMSEDMRRLHYRWISLTSHIGQF